MMKVLQVITSLQTGGAEKLIVDMVPMYRKRGLDVDVLLFDGSETPFKKVLTEQGIRIFEFCQGGSVYNPLNIVKLIPFLRKYDIVHTHNTAPQLFAAIGSVLCSVALCTTEHTTSNRRRGLKWYAPIDRWMYGRYKKVISISPATTSELVKYVKVKCPIVTIPNGIDTAKYCLSLPADRAAIGCKEKDFILMMVAGFRYQKDQDTIIRAMRLLPKNVVLCLVGDGVRRKECEELACREGLANRVKFAGLRSDVPNVLKAADVVVMSSHYEGFGLAAVEGMAAGKPVVASDVMGLGEVVRGYGCLFPQGDEVALANAIKDLLQNHDYYDKIARQCSERALDFDISKMVDAYIDVYKSITSPNLSTNMKI